MLVERTVPEVAKKACASPTLLTDGGSKELKAALAKDGTALVQCEARRRAAVEGAP